jgi:hypothetical protein
MSTHPWNVRPFGRSVALTLCALTGPALLTVAGCNNEGAPPTAPTAAAVAEKPEGGDEPGPGKAAAAPRGKGDTSSRREHRKDLGKSGTP